MESGSLEGALEKMHLFPWPPLPHFMASITFSRQPHIVLPYQGPK